jgi:tRNA A-37 threonylcarbamoyl transferase component Bud32
MQKLKIVKSPRLEDNEQFDHFLRQLPQTFDALGTPIHQGRNVIRLVDATTLDVGCEQMAIKHFHGLLFFQKWDYTFRRKPKCERAFLNTVELRRRGFSVANELAYVEVWNHGLYQRSYYLSEVAQGQRLDSLVMAMRERGEEAAIRELIGEYAALVKRLHEHGVLYWDMNCGNVICSRPDAGAPWHFTLIDTNRVRFFDEHTPLGLDTVVGDLILMNPRMGTVELFIAEYLKQRGLYTEEEARRIRQIQRERYEKKRFTWKRLFKRFKGQYYKLLGK